ncbi:MAG: hypothetical protein B7Z73_00715, partial [Planctomycetia bacterium 21-64-5]
MDRQEPCGGWGRAWPDPAKFEDTLCGQAMPRRVKPGHRLAAERILKAAAATAKLCPSHRLPSI